MKALILSALFFLLTAVSTAAGPPSSTPRPRGNFEHLAPHPGDPMSVPTTVEAGGSGDNPASAPAMNGWNIRVADILSGGGGDIEIVGDLAYAGGYGTLLVLDISDLATPTRVGFTLLAGSCRNVTRNGNYLYCTTEVDPNRYLQIVDISSPLEPIVVQTLPISGDAIAVDNGSLYLEHGNGIRVYELNDPTNPTLRGFCESNHVVEIAARDGYAYVARGSGVGKGVQIIDATTPAAPTTVTIVTVNSDPYSTGPWDIDLDGNYIYALTFAPNIIYVINVSNPAAPSVVSSIPGGLLVDIDAQGNYVYAGDDGGYVRVFDVTNPASPAAWPPLYRPCGGTKVGNISIAGNIGAVGSGGTCFINLSLPNIPIAVAAYTSSFTGGFNLDIAGGHLAFSQGNGWLAVHNRYDTSLRYSAPGTGYYVDWTHVAVKGNYAYVSMCDSWISDWGDDGLEVFDLTDPTNPTRVGLLPTSWCARELSIGANHAYVATHGEIWIVDISNPAAPTKASSFLSWVNDVAVEEPYLYAVDDNELLVFDVSDPSDAVHVASLPTPGLASALWVSESYVYIAAGASLLIADVSNPLSPEIVASHPTTYCANVRVRDHYAYLSDTNYLRILDVTEPTSPVEVGNIETNELRARVAVAPPYIYALTEGPAVIFETPLITGAPGIALKQLALRQNYPNPFNPATTIAFETATSGRVQLDVFDVRGRLVRRLIDESMPSGLHSVAWDGRDGFGNAAGSGVYFYRLQANGKSEAKKMVILK